MSTALAYAGGGADVASVKSSTKVSISMELERYKPGYVGGACSSTKSSAITRNISSHVGAFTHRRGRGETFFLRSHLLLSS